MNRMVLLSLPNATGVNQIFPDELRNKVLGYLPVDGGNTPERYVKEWRGYADKFGAKFRFINNSFNNAINEQKKLLECNICFISGGNTFLLLRNLRQSGLDQALRKFAEKEEFVLAGASAGALALTPTIEICNLPGFDENRVGLSDLTGLGLVDFEVWPHFVEERDKELLDKYRVGAKNQVREIRDGEWIVIDW